MKRPLAYITAPWSNSQYENAENAAAYCRQVYDAGYSPICPVLFLPTFLKDEIPQEHKDGLDMARDYLRRSHVLVVCGHGIDETVKDGKNAFDDMGVKKLPKVKELQTEYARLLEEKKKTYAEYRHSREEMRELLAAKANVDRLMDTNVEPSNSKEHTLFDRS